MSDGLIELVTCGVPQSGGLNPKDAIGRAKAPMHLVPPALYAPVAEVMRLGAEKYGPYNWRLEAVNLTVYLDAMKRHWDAVVDGQWLDAESKRPHLAHVAANCGIILDALKHHKLNVDLVTLKGEPALVGSNDTGEKS